MDQKCFFVIVIISHSQKVSIKSLRKTPDSLLTYGCSRDSERGERYLRMSLFQI